MTNPVHGGGLPCAWHSGEINAAACSFLEICFNMELHLGKLSFTTRETFGRVRDVKAAAGLIED